MDIVNEFLRNSLVPESEWKNKGCQPKAKMLKCQDGFYFSVQASKAHYCYPRINNDIGCPVIYLTVEVSYPSKQEDSLIPYADSACGGDFNTGYGCVPIKIVEDIIVSHGGIKRYKPLEAVLRDTVKDFVMDRRGDELVHTIFRDRYVPAGTDRGAVQDILNDVQGVMLVMKILMGQNYEPMCVGLQQYLDESAESEGELSEN